jgi:hypothetical protein
MSMLSRTVAGLPMLAVLASGVASGDPVMTPTFNPARFAQPVQNSWFPLVPGRSYIFEAQLPDGLLRTEVTITAEKKLIAGVWATVVHDVVWEDVAGGPTVLIEDTLDWYAADDSGNIWYLGEATVEYLYDDQWTPIGSSTEGSWEAGIDSARPGFIMPASPTPGFAYRQEYAAGVAEDLAKVERLNARVSVPFGTFTDTLVTKEWTTLERGAVERKYYAAGIGLVLVEEFHGQATVREELVAVTGPASASMATPRD